MTPKAPPFRAHDYVVIAGRLRHKSRAEIAAEMEVRPRFNHATVRPQPRKPVASVPVEPEPERIIVNARPEPSRHDELSSRVAALVREGKSYKEAMDIVLEDAPAPAPKKQTDRIMTRAELLECLTWLRAFQEYARTKPREWPLRAIDTVTLAHVKLGPVSAARRIRELLPMDDGSFERTAHFEIHHGHDITAVLNDREKLILAGKVPS